MNSVAPSNLVMDTDQNKNLSFEEREANLLYHIPKGHDLPARLYNWRERIVDEEFYLAELQDYVLKSMF